MPAPIFTRRHYCAVAGLIRDAACLDPETRGRLVSDFAAMFSADNERFKPDRFRAAAHNGVKLDEREPQSLKAELSERDRLEGRGCRDGHAAAAWFAPQDEEAARRVRRGLDQEDPEILDELPSPRLGGECADEPTWENILEDEGIEHGDDGRPALLGAYEYAYTCALERELVRSCRARLGLYPEDLQR